MYLNSQAPFKKIQKPNLMKLLYWNVKESISDEKKSWIENAISSEQPEIICIAEGPESIRDCEEIESFITQKNYRTYYAPTLYLNPIISNQFGWNKYGLKVFHKANINLKTRFAFGNQKLEGRIIYLRFEKDAICYSTFLIHGMSKVGDEINQSSFICELSSFVRAKTIGRETDRIIIMGDFNLEPWDDLLKNKTYIHSFFYPKLFDYYSVRLTNRVYYNPILNYIQNHADENLIGTFYNDKYISILDYPLVSKGFNNYEFNILTSINGNSLMKSKQGKHLLHDNLDHLPITLKIN